MADIIICTAKQLLTKSKAMHLLLSLLTNGHSARDAARYQALAPCHTKGTEPHRGMQIHIKHAEVLTHTDMQDECITPQKVQICTYLKYYLF